jgi:hypothetical protein
VPVRRIGLAGDDRHAARPGCHAGILEKLDTAPALDNVHWSYPCFYISSVLLIEYGHTIELLAKQKRCRPIINVNFLLRGSTAAFGSLPGFSVLLSKGHLRVGHMATLKPREHGYRLSFAAPGQCP